jgi:hypothetical protein
LLSCIENFPASANAASIESGKISGFSQLLRWQGLGVCVRTLLHRQWN